MGWSTGSEILGELIPTIKANVLDKGARRRIYRKLIEIFENNDADTLDEALGEDSIYDDVYRELYPDNFEE